jgi:glycosyltransferase involved in cell wall biosynthesis
MELTVIIPIYNRARMLAQALESLRWQTYKDFVVIICDDASTENLKEVVDKFLDLKIEYHRYETNAGQFKNAMRGLEICQTQFVKYLHSDDLLFPEALERQVIALQKVHNAAICLGGTVSFEEAQEQNQINLFGYTKPYVPEPRTNRQWARLEYYNGYLPSASMYRTELFRNIGGLNTGLKAVADWEIFVAISSKYPVIAVDEPVCAYRSHANQITKDFFFDTEAALTKDVLWMTSSANPYRERLGLESGQIAYLRQDIFWQNLRIALTSSQKLVLLKKWLKMANLNKMFWPFIFAFPWFVILKILRKPKVQTDTLKSLNMEKYNDYIYSILFTKKSAGISN